MENLIFIFNKLFTKIAFAAQELKTGKGKELPNPLGVTTISELLNRIINYLLIVSAPLLVIFLILGAFKILTAAGNPTKIKTGKDIILYSIIGFTIVLISKGVAIIIVEVLK